MNERMIAMLKCILWAEEELADIKRQQEALDKIVPLAEKWRAAADKLLRLYGAQDD